MVGVPIHVQIYFRVHPSRFRLMGSDKQRWCRGKHWTRRLVEASRLPTGESKYCTNSGESLHFNRYQQRHKKSLVFNVRVICHKQVLDINTLGLIDVTVTFLPLLKRAKGRIVNTASVFGRCSLAGSTPYCISKYGVECFSDGIRWSFSFTRMHYVSKI